MTKIIFFDVETNGKEKGCSVLSISAIKCQFNGKEVIEVEKPFIRYYYRKPGEKIDQKALEINGLNDKEIELKRKDSTYELFFFMDEESFHDYCRGVNHFVGHNIDFDEKYINNFKLKYTFCTMRENTNIIQIKNEKGKNKWPTLEETAKYYEIELNSNHLHDSYYDISLTFKIFKKMIRNQKTRNKVLKFLKKQ